MNPVLLRAAHVRQFLPKRVRDSHKGDNGHVLIVAGSQGMTGAAYLCALGALKAGAGLVTVAGSSDVRRLIVSRLPEVMTIPATLGSIKAYVRRRTITTLAAGPGLTVGPSQRGLLKGLLNLNVPMVLDADGLNNLTLKDLAQKPVVITPHAGEMAKLLATTAAKIQKNRIQAAQECARRAKILCVLKGHGTLISDGQKMWRNPTGNPAMATGGMGDVLTGIIAAFLAQGLSRLDAACAGVYLHGLAGDLAATGDRGLRASELALAVPAAIKKVLA